MLDFSHALAGPYCTLLFGSYGADVYKLESAVGGDMGRGWGPPFAGGEASYFLGLNREKQGISINLKHPEGIDLCMRIIDRMDVLVENFRPGTMDRLGLGYEAVHQRNHRLVYCSISGYGQHGPSRDEAAMDLIVQSSCGLMSITGTEEGEIVRCGYGVTDVTAGLFAVIGILMALLHRDRTGSGQFVDVSMFDGMISSMTSNYMSYLGSSSVPKPLGTSFPTVVPYRVFQARDRSFSLAIGSEKLWSTFCDVMQNGDLRSDPRFATNALRVANRAGLEELLAAVFAQEPAAFWLQMLHASGIPSSLVLSYPEVVEHPQAAFRQMFPTLDHPTAGLHKVTGTPVKMSDTPGRVSVPAPLLGEDTSTALIDLLGLDATQMEDLAARGVIFDNHRVAGL